MRLGFGAAGESVGFCQHASCREEQARELSWLGAVLQRNDLRVLAEEAHRSSVRCRHQPRKGPVHAPLPPRNETA